MSLITANTRKAAPARTLSAGQKAEAALETLRGTRSVRDIAAHWGVEPAELLHWQHTLVERAHTLFGEQGRPASTRLKQAQLANEALISKVFEQMDARDVLQQSATNLHRLLAQQDQLNEAERKRLAIEIHDELGQNLLAIRIDISMLQDRTRERHPQLHRRVGMVLANIDSAVRASRSIINDLRPFELELGLPAAVQWLMNRFERTTGRAVRLDIDGLGDDSAALGDGAILNLFRTLQEWLAHVIQDASASCVGVSLRRLADGVQLVVEDNGAGAMGAPMPDGDSVGLAGMRERASALGGQLCVERLAGGGTRLQTWIPLPAVA